jgi:2-polyprenyl-6-methoxyphenol hydroxylase-like FAD-dependent oxidoreductase
MRHTDVVIAGGGLAGSIAAAMLGRAGIGAVMVDPHPVYPPDFRCEKLDGAQMCTFALTGLADAVLRASTPDRHVWVRPGDQQGIMYGTLVNTMRAPIPAGTAVICGKVAAIANGADRQTVTLADGSTISARLVVIASGLNLACARSSALRGRLSAPVIRCRSASTPGPRGARPSTSQR